MRETYMEDMWGFALCGYLGNKDINLMASMRNVNYNYLYDEEGYVIEIREGNNKYIISYGETIPSNPDPPPAIQQPMKNSKVLSATLPKAPKIVLLKSLSPVMALHWKNLWI